MLVDAYTHFIPAQLLKTVESLGAHSGLVQRMAAIRSRELHDLDARFRAMDALGDYRQLMFTAPNPPIETITTPAQGRDFARVANDALAEIVCLHPDRFPAFVAAIPCHDMDSNMDELKRSIETLGARGVQIYTNVNGRPLDDPEFEPIFRSHGTV